MKHTKKIQANYRLPEPLLRELKDAATAMSKPQSAIVYEALREKLADLSENSSSNDDVKRLTLCDGEQK